MNPLGKEAQELLELCRDADDPSPSDQARVRRRLGTALATGATAAATQAAAAKTLGASTAPAALTTGKVATLLAGSLTIGIASAGLLTVALPSDPVTPPATVADAARAAPPARAPAEYPERPQEVAPEPAAKAASIDKAGAPMQERATRERAKRPSGPAPTAPNPSTLTAETRLLERARAALSSGDAAGALRLSAEHQRRFPTGVLAEEAMVTELLALCRLGRTKDALALGRRFAQSAPNSPLRARVAASCAGAAFSETD